MRRVPAVLLVALVVLSGCGGLLGGGPGGSPAPGSDESTPPAAAEEVPGVEDGELTDTRALLSAHRTELLETGFESDFRVNATERYQGERYEASRRSQAVVEPGAEEYVFRDTNYGEGARFDHWGNDSVTLTRARLGDQTRYQRGPATDPTVLTNTRVMGSYLNATNFSVTNVERRQNLTLVTLVSQGTPEATPAIAPRNATDLREYETRVVVDTTGRILTFEAEGTYTLGGSEGSMDLSYEVVRADRPGVERPDWATRVLRQSGDES